MSHNTPRILITRLSAIGDCIHTMPLVGVLRRRFPEAYIAWATQPAPASLLDGYAGLDELIVVPRDWMKSLSEVRRVRALMRSRQFEIAIDPQGLTKSAALAWLSGAKLRVGFAAPQGRELSHWLNNRIIHPQLDHVVDRYLELLRPVVGAVDRTPRFELAVDRHASISEFLDQSELHGNFAVINPGAGWDSKLWLPERFGDVACHLGRSYRLRTVVVWAGDREQQWARQIVACSKGFARIAPPTTLPELADLLQHARLCVSADTGPLHLAASLGIACVGLYGSTQPSVCGPYGTRHATVQAFYQAGGSRQRRRADNDAMQAIDADTVIQACDDVLRALGQQRAA